jgi:hypothetical protein
LPYQPPIDAFPSLFVESDKTSTFCGVWLSSNQAPGADRRLFGKPELALLNAGLLLSPLAVSERDPGGITLSAVDFTLVRREKARVAPSMGGNSNEKRNGYRAV